MPPVSAAAFRFDCEPELGCLTEHQLGQPTPPECKPSRTEAKEHHYPSCGFGDGRIQLAYDERAVGTGGICRRLKGS